MFAVWSANAWAPLWPGGPSWWESWPPCRCFSWSRAPERTGWPSESQLSVCSSSVAPASSAKTSSCQSSVKIIKAVRNRWKNTYSERLLYDLVLPVFNHQVKRSFVFLASLAAQIHFTLKLLFLKQWFVYWRKLPVFILIFIRRCLSFQKLQVLLDVFWLVYRLVWKGRLFVPFRLQRQRVRAVVQVWVCQSQPQITRRRFIRFLHELVKVLRMKRYFFGVGNLLVQWVYIVSFWREERNAAACY